MPIRRTILIVGSSLVAALSIGCGRDWDAFDPRRGAEAASASSSGTGGGGGSAQSSSSSAASGGGGAGGASTSLCKVSLQNDFEDGVVDGGPWVNYHADVVNVAEVSGELIFELPASSTESVWGVFETGEPHDLTGCAVHAKVIEVPNAAADAYTNLAISIDDANYVEIVSFEGRTRFNTIVEGSHNELVIVDNDFGQHAYWRIREDEGKTYWETSPDGQKWNLQLAAPNVLPFDSMKVTLGTGTLTKVTQPIGRARFDDLVIGP